MKRKLLLAALLVTCALGMRADDVFKDVTSTYLTNADFEGEYQEIANPEKATDNKIAKPNGWILSFSGASTDGTDAVGMNSSYAAWSNFSDCASLTTGGNNTYWVRMKWGTSQNLQLYQEVTLPKGKYTLTADYYKNGLGGDGYVMAGSVTNNTNKNENAWKSVTVEFSADGTSKYKLGLKVVHTSSGSDKKLAFDNFVLQWNLTQSLADLLEEANSFIGGESDSYTSLQSAINAADAVKESTDASTLEDQYTALAAALDFAKNHLKPWLDAKTAAQAAIANTTDYGNVVGEEKTNLQDAINAVEPSDQDGYDTAKTDLETKTSVFTSAKASYDAFVDAKAKEYTNNLPYASAAKFAAIGTAQDAAAATSAADATAKTNAIISAYRKYVESNALAEGVTGAVNNTSLISDPNMDVTYNSTTHTFGAWQVFGQTDGTIQLKDETESLTDGDGEAIYKFADIWKSDNNAGIKQTLTNLPAGKYLLTVAARAQDTSGALFEVFAGSTKQSITRINASGGVYGRGWNDASVEFIVKTPSDVEIGVKSGNGKSLWWSATRFRLVKLAGTEDVKMTMKANKWGTFIAPFDVTIPNGVNAYTVTGVDANGYMVKDNVSTTIPANTPVVLENTNDVAVDETFTGVNIAEADSYTEGQLTGIYTAATIPAGSYVLQTPISTGVQAFYPLASDLTGGTPNRCYLTLPASAAKRNAVFFDKEEGTTGIEAPNATNGEDGVFYNLAGQRVNRSYKGIIIQNRKAKLNK